MSPVTLFKYAELFTTQMFFNTFSLLGSHEAAE